MFKVLRGIKKKLEREYDEVNSKIIEGRKITHKVVRPEDIAIPKIVRSIGSLKRNPKFSRYIPRQLNPLSYESIARELERISEIREEAIISPSNPKLAEQLRFISDLYDVRVLSELTGFNEPYMVSVGKNWNVFMENSDEKRKIASAVLPDFN